MIICKGYYHYYHPEFNLRPYRPLWNTVDVPYYYICLSSKRDTLCL